MHIYLPFFSNTNTCRAHVVLRCFCSCLLVLSRHISPTSVHAHAAAGGYLGTASEFGRAKMGIGRCSPKSQEQAPRLVNARDELLATLSLSTYQTLRMDAGTIYCHICTYTTTNTTTTRRSRFGKDTRFLLATGHPVLRSPFHREGGNNARTFVCLRVPNTAEIQHASTEPRTHTLRFKPDIKRKI